MPIRGATRRAWATGACCSPRSTRRGALRVWARRGRSGGNRTLGVTIAAAPSLSHEREKVLAGTAVPKRPARSAAPGDAPSLLGPNGAGKSALVGAGNPPTITSR
jgi:hypothetical protein